MQPMYCIGLDVHKRKISYCVKDSGGKVYAEGSMSATRFDLDRWMKTLPQPWSAAMEATMFTGWIYDHLKPHAATLKVAHPLMLRAIALAKKKNDRIDANKICDCLRCDFLPECYMASTAIRERRRTLRYRNLLVRQMVQMKIKISALLMEAGVSYNKQRLHGHHEYSSLGYPTGLARPTSSHEGCSIRHLWSEALDRAPNWTGDCSCSAFHGIRRITGIPTVPRARRSRRSDLRFRHVASPPKRADDRQIAQLLVSRITGHLLPVRTSHAAGMKFERNTVRSVALL